MCRLFCRHGCGKMMCSCWTGSFFSMENVRQYLQVIVEVIGETDMDSEKRGAGVRSSFKE